MLKVRFNRERKGSIFPESIILIFPFSDSDPSWSIYRAQDILIKRRGKTKAETLEPLESRVILRWTERFSSSMDLEVGYRGSINLVGEA